MTIFFLHSSCFKPMYIVQLLYYYIQKKYYFFNLFNITNVNKKICDNNE